MCGRLAVPRKSASINDTKSTRSSTLPLRSPLKVGLLPGCRRRSPRISSGAAVLTAVPSAPVVLLVRHAATSLSLKTRRNSIGPSAPVRAPSVRTSPSASGVAPGTAHAGSPATEPTPRAGASRAGPGACTSNPRPRISATRIAQSASSRPPLMNCTQVVLTMPAVATITVTTTPTRPTPTHCGRPRSGLISAPAPTICGTR